MFDDGVSSKKWKFSSSREPTSNCVVGLNSQESVEKREMLLSKEEPKTKRRKGRRQRQNGAGSRKVAEESLENGSRSGSSQEAERKGRSSSSRNSSSSGSSSASAAAPPSKFCDGSSRRTRKDTEARAAEGTRGARVGDRTRLPLRGGCRGAGVVCRMCQPRRVCAAREGVCAHSALEQRFASRAAGFTSSSHLFQHKLLPPWTSSIPTTVPPGSRSSRARPT